MIKPAWYPDDRQLRQFSIAAVTILPAVALIGWRFKGWTTASVWFSAVGAGIFLLSLVSLNAVYPIYSVLMLVAMPIGWLISNIFLRIIYYVILTPLGLLFRLIGRDPLVLKRPSRDSYWVVHKRVTDQISYYRQA